MKIARKEFHHPDGTFSKDFLWWGNEKKKKWLAKSLSDVRQAAMDFVNSLGPGKLVTINEYTTAKEICGDDMVTHWVVWYWENESDSNSPTAN